MKGRKLLSLAILSTGAIVLSGCFGSGNSGGGNPGNTVINLWTTTSTPNGALWTQSDRLARPVVNEVFATVANGRHAANDHIAPTSDKNEIFNDISTFMDKAFAAVGKKRSAATVSVIQAVLVPDVMKADLSQSGNGAYLGVETGGVTGSKFGGRALTDDVVDASLGVVFGNTVSVLGLAPDDGQEISTLTSDHVDASGKHFTNTFPYLGSPR